LPENVKHQCHFEEMDHAINIQCVCDANYMIRDIVAKWPGATHDAHIWNNCKLAKAFEDGTIKGAWLLGDSG
jgi:hypothetical protein